MLISLANSVEYPVWMCMRNVGSNSLHPDALDRFCMDEFESNY